MVAHRCVVTAIACIDDGARCEHVAIVTDYLTTTKPWQTSRLIEPKNLFRCSDAIAATSQGTTHCIAERQRASAGAAGVGRGGAVVEGKRRCE
jgi:hypothetical protein